MRRRALLAGLSSLPFVGVGRAAAQAGQLQLHIVGHPRDTQATFRLTNRLSEAITYASWDGGGVHNGLQQEGPGGWSDVGLGYCGLGHDGDLTIAPGRSATFRAYVGSTPGRFRITLDVTRASGARDVVVSAPFTVA
jgi:hypothetical protein